MCASKQLSIKQTVCYKRRMRAVFSKDNKLRTLKKEKKTQRSSKTSFWETNAIKTRVNYDGAVQACWDLLSQH